jgi:hypothetical protein
LERAHARIRTALGEKYKAEAAMKTMMEEKVGDVCVCVCVYLCVCVCTVVIINGLDGCHTFEAMLIQ